ncbi:MAG: hypothetical protein ACI9FN_000083 [Saprospiraceae bacterium]|jgi:hypothetical protein
MMTSRKLNFLFVLLSVLFIVNCTNSKKSLQVLAGNKSLPEKVDFNFHIKPLLADRCFTCHGPDGTARKAELRLDEEAFAKKTLESGKKALHAGSLAKSEVWKRINSENQELVMPPPESHLSLTDYEKALIGKWIQEGAIYQKHWAYVPPNTTVLLNIENSLESSNPIDDFIQEKLMMEDLAFSPLADKEVLLRRVTFDLTGLPPTLKEIDEFLEDNNANAYEKVIDRLLKSSAYAERMTMDWLDLARYADSQGLHSDGWRSMYPWRDWVLQTFNKNMPFDQFLTWQIAGDLMPQPSRDQLIATGFNRNHKTTAEGGVVDEEVRMEYVHDRVATTATVFMGLTMECARCHDHKYDPISQEEYYQFAAFFNQVDELGMSGDDGNAGPNLLLPSIATEQRLKEIQMEILQKRASITINNQELAELKRYINQLQKSPSIQKQANVYLPFEKIKNSIADGFENATFSGDVKLLPTDRGNAVSFNQEYQYLTIKNEGLFEQNQAFAAAVWIKLKGLRRSQTIVGNSAQKGTFWRGWDFALDSLNRLSVRLINALPHDAIVVHTIDKIPINKWNFVAFSYDGSGKASGVKLFIQGEEKQLHIQYDNLQRSLYPIAFSKKRRNMPLRLGKSYRGFTGEYGIFEGEMDDFLLYNRQLHPLEIRELANQTTLKETLDEFKNNPIKQLEKDLFALWRTRNRLPLDNEIEALRGEQIGLLDTVPEVMIIQEVPKGRPTFVLNRGNYNEPLQEVQPNTPKKILNFPDSLPQNRLGLAKWLTDKENPLTARVVVNRYWQQLFGNGLVRTSHDFGLQGSLPTHPELLDWLAGYFVENDWNIKDLLKLIVRSKTYRQSSITSADLLEKDPNNTLLARGPSYRLPAEMIRDNALASSNLLKQQIGGPSVKPLQPEGLWQEKTSSTHLLAAYEPDRGTARYRRSLYTFLRRTSPPPAMAAFDAPNRSECTTQRQITNTPMQALVLLNDPQFVEASIKLAEQVFLENINLEKRITTAFRLLTSRKPTKEQLNLLELLYQEEEARFQQTPKAAIQYLQTGQFAPMDSLPPISLAAMSLVVNTIMNFDEFYMKR